jgi:hypothetical protein
MAFTVTATQSGAVAARTTLRVKVLTGAAAAASQTGATAGQHATAAQQVSITTTVTGSVVYGSMWTANAATFTANGNTTMIDNTHDSDLTHGNCKASAATGTPGATSIGASAPSANGSIALLEVLPNGTIAEDASGPAWADANATSATTASFTPPGGSLLVALINTNGTAGVVNMAVTDTSGLGISWTEKSVQHPSGGAYAGVWVADMPGGTTVSGAVSALALAAPAGDVQVQVPGPVSAMALAAPAGAVAVSGAATITGAVAQLALTAQAGIPAGIGGGGDDAPWHIRRRR